MSSIYIYGAGGFGKEVYYLIKNAKNSPNLLGFIDNFCIHKSLFQLPILNFVPENSKFIIAIADPKTKRDIATKHQLQTISYSVVHQNITLNKTINLKEGTILCEGVICTVDISIGKHVIINLNCTIGHDSCIADYCSIMPSVNISGNVRIGEGSFIGSGVTILPNIKIGKWCKIGAGAVIINDIPDYSVVVGVPGKVIKTITPQQ